ncbi:MAG: hypothetical protein ABII88_09740 [Candidatus Omnitrophota bacterium]
MKKYLITFILTLLVIFEILLLVGLFGANQIDRRSHAKAVANWHNNPTAENKKILEKEQIETKKQTRIILFFMFAILSLNSWGIVFLFKKRVRLTTHST